MQATWMMGAVAAVTLAASGVQAATGPGYTWVADDNSLLLVVPVSTGGNLYSARDCFNKISFAGDGKLYRDLQANGGENFSLAFAVAEMVDAAAAFSSVLAGPEFVYAELYADPGLHHSSK